MIIVIHDEIRSTQEKNVTLLFREALKNMINVKDDAWRQIEVKTNRRRSSPEKIRKLPASKLIILLRCQLLGAVESQIVVKRSAVVQLKKRKFRALSAVVCYIY